MSHAEQAPRRSPAGRGVTACPVPRAATRVKDPRRVRRGGGPLPSHCAVTAGVTLTVLIHTFRVAGQTGTCVLLIVIYTIYTVNI